jgi:hypothetical protein
MSQKRRELKVARLTLENNILGILQSTPDEIKRCQQVIQNFAEGKPGKGGNGKTEPPDPRTQFLAAKHKTDMAMAVIEYKNPPVKKLDANVNLGLGVDWPKKKPLGAPVDKREDE